MVSDVERAQAFAAAIEACRTSAQTRPDEPPSFGGILTEEERIGWEQ